MHASNMIGKIAIIFEVAEINGKTNAVMHAAHPATGLILQQNVE